MIPVASILNKASGFFFTAGFLVANSKYIVPLFLVPITQLISLLLNLIAYALSLFAHQFRSEYQPKKEWYGFASFKEQLSYAALLGLYASTISIAALYFPILIIPSAWLFFAGNLMSSISEFHKLNNPFYKEENYSSKRQSRNVTYTLILAFTALVGALSTSLIFIFPIATAYILGISTLLALGLGALNAKYWLEINLGDYKNTEPLLESYEQMIQSLGADAPLPVKDVLPIYHGNSIFITKKTNQLIMQEINSSSCKI